MVEHNMENSNQVELDVVSEVVVKQESLAEDDGLQLQHIQAHQPGNADRNDSTVNTQVNEECQRVYIQSSETYALVKQEPTTCDEEAIVMCAMTKADDLADQTSTTHQDDVIWTGSGRPLGKFEGEPIVLGTANVASISKTDKLLTNAAGADGESHSSSPVPLSFTSNDMPYPIALYQRIRPLASDETTTCEYYQIKSCEDNALESTAIISSSSDEIRCTSNNITSDQRPEREKGTHRCSLCDYSSAYKRFLRSHMTTHMGEKPYKCSICDYSSAYKSSLVIHMRTHTGEKPYKCTVCAYSSSMKAQLVIHMRRHTGDKPYKCSLCDHRTVKSSDIVSHMRTHTGEKPYKCSICKYSSSEKRTLDCHMRTHTGEKPYKCTTCEYSSAYKQAMERHMQAHTGEKPYKCQVCDYCSSRKGSLARHMKTHAGVKS